MNTARLIVTLACPRRCSYCCNDREGILDGAVEISDLRMVADFPEICITGGEPTLNVNRTAAILRKLRQYNPDVKLFMYTASYRESWALRLLPLLDGVYYTLHENAEATDIHEFHGFQTLAAYYPGKSFRLNIHQGNKDGFVIRPNVWSRITLHMWTRDTDCAIPAHETLFVLKNWKGNY